VAKTVTLQIIYKWKNNLLMTGNLSDAQIIYYYSVNVIDLWDGKLWNEYNCRTNKYFIFYIILSTAI